MTPDHSNGLSPTLQINSLSALPIVRNGGIPLYAGDIVANNVAMLIYNSTLNSYVLQNPIYVVNPTQVQQSVFNAATDSGSANTYVCGLNPSVGSLTDGLNVLLLAAAHTNTGASTLNVNGTAISIVNLQADALTGGEIVATYDYSFIYNATNNVFVLQNSSLQFDDAIAAINGDSGTVLPNAGIITISGGSNGITTTGSSHTLGLALSAIASNTLLANASGGSSKPISTTLTALIDAAIGSTQGDILYRNSTAWVVLAPGTSGYFLQTQGASANPQWAAQSASSVTFTGDSGTPFAGTAVTVTGGTTGLTFAAGTPNLTLGGTLALASGGTNHSLTASAGGIVWSDSSKLNILGGTSTAGQLLLSGDAATPAWSTSTYPSTNAVNTLLYASSANTMAALATGDNGVLITSNSGVPSWLANGTAGYALVANSGAPPSWQAVGAAYTPAALTESNDTNVTMTLGGTPSTALLQAVSMTLGWIGELSLARGGTNANLTASNGGIFYSTASAGAILAGTVTANQVLLSGSSTTPAWSTATYPASTTINQLLFSSANNVISGITAGDYGVLVSSSAGVPSWPLTEQRDKY